MEEKLEEMFSHTQTPLAVQVIPFFAKTVEFERIMEDMTAAFIHADIPVEKVHYPLKEITRPEWVWKLSKAINGRNGSKTNFSRFFAEVAVCRLHLIALIGTPNVPVTETANLALGVRVEEISTKAQVFDRIWLEMRHYLFMRKRVVFDTGFPVEYLYVRHMREEESGREVFQIRRIDKYSDSCCIIRSMEINKQDDNTVIQWQESDSISINPTDVHRMSVGVVRLQFAKQEYPGTLYVLKQFTIVSHEGDTLTDEAMETLLRQEQSEEFISVSSS